LADTDYHGIFKQPAGSNKYAAPEQVAGDVPLDCRADIYAFGVILKQIFPRGYNNIIRKCTQVDREKRFSNADETLFWLRKKKRLRPVFWVITALLCALIVVGLLLSKDHHPQAESDPVEMEDNVSTEASDIIDANDEIPTSPATQEVANNVAVPAAQSATNTPAKEVDKMSEEYLYRQIPTEVKKNIEQSLDTLFRQFWDWNKAVTARGMSSVNKLSEYTQSDFFKNNYDIRERHRNLVINDMIRRYPQCEGYKDTMTTFYNALFVKRMIAVNNLVVSWQRDAAKGQ